MRNTKAAAAVIAASALTALAAGCGSSGTTSSSSGSVPAQLTVWRMGNSTPAQVSWMNGVVTQFHKDYPAYAKTKIHVVFVPWGNRTTDWTTAFSSGKNGPDVTELGNTDTLYTIPPIVFFLIVQRKMARGLVAGAVKG